MTETVKTEVFLQVAHKNIDLIREHLNKLDTAIGSVPVKNNCDPQKLMNFVNTLAAVEYLFRKAFPAMEKEVTCS